MAFPIERYQQSDSSQEEDEEGDALEPERRTVRQRLVPQKKPDHRPRKRAFESTPKKALASRPATTTTTAAAALPFVFGAPPALSPTAPGGLFGVFDSSKMVIKFTGGSENETVKEEEQEQEEKEEESKEGDDVDEGTSDKKPHKDAQPAVYKLPVPELEKQIKVCVSCVCV